MQFELTEKQYRRLLDMVYIGNWVLNSTRGEDRFEDYDLLQEKMFAYCAKNGMKDLYQTWYGHVFPSKAFEGIFNRISLIIPMVSRSYQSVKTCQTPPSNSCAHGGQL